jgi:hypothetical protein
MNKTATLLWEILAGQVSQEAQQWLKSKEQATPLEIMTAFVAAPRHLPKSTVVATEQQLHGLREQISGFSVEGWSVSRLARVWLLCLFDAQDRTSYVHHIWTLFDTAEMNELVALYSALPVLSYPEEWLASASDAVRSNIGIVLDAIALRNPYPARYFSESAWNQLVMKVIFNDKPIHLIEGVERRANADLAAILRDFAQERWAAGRQVAPEVWRLTVNFVQDSFLSELKQLFESGRADNREAATLVCLQSGFPPALELLEYFPEMKALAMEGKLSWKNLEYTDLNTYVS